MMTATMIKAVKEKTARGAVYCLICTHTVDAEVVQAGRKAFVKPGQKCPRCSSSLDPGYVVGVNEAA